MTQPRLLKYLSLAANYFLRRYDVVPAAVFNPKSFDGAHQLVTSPGQLISIRKRIIAKPYAVNLDRRPVGA